MISISLSLPNNLISADFKHYIMTINDQETPTISEPETTRTVPIACNSSNNTISIKAVDRCGNNSTKKKTFNVSEHIVSECDSSADYQTTGN